MNKEQEIKKVLFDSKRWIQFRFIKLGLKAMKNKNLYDAEIIALNHPKEKDSEKILKMVHREMDLRHLKHLNVGYVPLKNRRNKNESK